MQAKVLIFITLLSLASAAAEPGCQILEAGGRSDKLTFAEAETCFTECRASFGASALWLKVALPGVLLVLVLVCPILSFRGVPPTHPAHELVMKMVPFLTTFLASLYVHLLAAVADWRGLHGTSCFKSGTCALFGRMPAFLGLLLGLLFLAHSSWQAFRRPVDEARLRAFCSRVPADDEEPETKVLGMPVKKERLERLKVLSKASLCLGAVVLDCGALVTFLHQGQPSYALLMLLTILLSEGYAKSQFTSEYTPHQLKGLWGWQADFIFFWRESIALGMASPAFLRRTALRVPAEAVWCGYVQFSALLSSTYSAWYPLANLCASVAMACLTFFSWGPLNEVFRSEDDKPQGLLKADGTFQVLHQHCRVIPRADFFARQRIQQLRSMKLVAAYRLCEFLAKGIVTAALTHLLSPMGTYGVGLLVALPFWPWRMRTQHDRSPARLLLWPAPFLRPAGYPLTIPTSEFWQTPQDSSPALTCTFFCIFWVLLLALSFWKGWAQRTWRGALEGELEPSRAHLIVKLALVAMGLLAQLGLMALALALERLRKGWYEEDAILLRELGNGRNRDHWGSDGIPVLRMDLLTKEPVQKQGGPHSRSGDDGEQLLNQE